jgi:proline dehydrogenase
MLKVLLTEGTYPAIATHDPVMIDLARDWARTHDIGQDRFEFQMLYGIRRDLQTKLVDEGYRLRIYVPFGREWFPISCGGSANARQRTLRPSGITAKGG